MRTFLALGLLLATACPHTASTRRTLVLDRARAELECADVDVQHVGGEVYVARGCGQRATYAVECDGNLAEDCTTRRDEAP